MTHDFCKLAIHEKISPSNMKISLKSQHFDKLSAAQSTVNSQQSTVIPLTSPAGCFWR
ncbi:hypothetical protein H6G33_16730 [Calothrix sp. FACHB-1219]|uniref:hypothetical protein n=1 Tax=unclassified Calothrix TaxID=2619626 RepID=UPI001682C8EB|nr:MULTISPECIES: hypothetical protein [unclassified Calothrix]MBD2203079.1 hypothetical protein [Calothrix sp. FACHB-168]MBD2218680.1 hypothetical protein [Calothrix sp. FACHB-1219]